MIDLTLLAPDWKGIQFAGLHYGATKDSARAYAAGAIRRDIRRAPVQLLTCGYQNFLLSLLSAFFLPSSHYLAAIFSRFTPIFFCIFSYTYKRLWFTSIFVHCAMSETAKSASPPLPRLPTPTASDSGARSLPPHPQKKDADHEKKATRAMPSSLKHNSKAKGNESMLAHVKMHLGNSSTPSVSNSELPSLSHRGDPFVSSSSVNLDIELGLREQPLVGDVPIGKESLDPTAGRRTTAGPSALEKEKKASEKNDATECESLDKKKSDNEKKGNS